MISWREKKEEREELRREERQEREDRIRKEDYEREIRREKNDKDRAEMMLIFLGKKWRLFTNQNNFNNIELNVEIEIVTHLQLFFNGAYYYVTHFFYYLRKYSRLTNMLHFASFLKYSN